MNRIQQHIEVYAHWVDLSQPTLVGVLYAAPSRGKEIFSFEYNHDCLNTAKPML
jgi:serine/threonine-protein kinase HipA